MRDVGSKESGLPTAVVVSDRPWTAGLGNRLAERTGWSVHEVSDPARFTPDTLRALGADVILVPFWSRLIPASIHRAFECVIFHSSPVPYGRGGSPIQNLIIRGHRTTAVTALRCEDELDAGPVYGSVPMELDGSLAEILERCVSAIEVLAVRILNERPEPIPQTGPVTTFRRRTPAQSDISDASTVAEAHDRIRMVDADGYPRAFIDLDGLRVEFSRAELVGDSVVAQARFVAKGRP